MDMCNGEIISYGIDKHPSTKNVIDALEYAIAIKFDYKYRKNFPFRSRMGLPNESILSSSQIRKNLQKYVSKGKLS